jgi:hypothetical protein
MFAAGQLGLAVAIDRWLPHFRDPFYAYKAARLRDRVLGTPARPLTVVMLGSSRTGCGLRGGLLEEQLPGQLGRPAVVFNLGIAGAGPVTELLSFQRLRAEGIRPDLLLVEVLPPLLAGQTPAPAEAEWLHADRLWLHELALLGRYNFPTDRLFRDWWQAWPVPCYGHRFAILSRLAPRLLPMQYRQDWSRFCDASGWAGITLDASWTLEQRRRAVERTQREYSSCFLGFRLGGPACQALRELLEACRRDGIATALVVMPEGTEFRSWYPPPVWEQIEQFLGELSREYDAPLINAREWVGDEHFSDSHHLLTSGATVFTRRLGREVLQPLLAGQRRATELAAGGPR